MSQSNILAETLVRLNVSPGDEDAWSSLYRQLRPFVFAVVYRRLTGDQRSSAEDATQEVFVKLLRSRAFADILDVDAFRAYVWKTADNVARTHLREKRVKEEGERTLAEWQGHTPTVEALDGEGELLAREVFDLAEHVLEPKDRELLRLLLDGLNLAQAAEKLGISYSNCGVRLHRMRRKLVNHMEPRKKENMPHM